jgi:pimeloyl-ACP methyl ester carboxylesterase
MLTLEHQVARPAQRRYATPLLLIHGAWHGAWCWKRAMQDFAERGFEVHAISLRGHGNSDQPRILNLCGLADYLRDVQTALASIHPRPVVVAHSMGAYVLQLLLTGGATHQPGPGALAGAVLVGSPPPQGIMRFLLRYARSHPVAFARAVATLNLRHMVGTPQLVRTLLVRPASADDDVRAVLAGLNRESLRVAIEMAVLVKPDAARNRTPLLVIGAEQDQLFGPADQHAIAAAYQAPLLMVPGAPHDLMLDSGWSQAADAITQFAGSCEPGSVHTAGNSQ